MHFGDHNPRASRRGDCRGSRVMRAIGVLAITLLWSGAASIAAAQTVLNETLVMPFENPQTEPKLYWLGEGSSVLLADSLERYGATTVPREERLTAFDRLQLPPAAVLSHATV